MSDVDYIALAFEPHGNVTMRQLRRAALREREAKDVLAARLAEVEGKLETAEGEAYYWRSLASENDAVDQLAAERDRLAQELEGALGHLRDVAKRARSLRDVEAERDEARRRLAEVEAENAELIEKLKAGLSRDDRTSLSSLFGYDLGVEEGRAEGQAERDRLAQRGVELLEKVQLFAATGQRVTQERDEAIGHLRAVLDAWDPMAENYEMGPFFEAREFLARFPVKEGDET